MSTYGRTQWFIETAVLLKKHRQYQRKFLLINLPVLLFNAFYLAKLVHCLGPLGRKPYPISKFLFYIFFKSKQIFTYFIETSLVDIVVIDNYIGMAQSYL